MCHPGMRPDMMTESAYCSRRDFLATSASGIGLVALASLLRDDGRLIASPGDDNSLSPLLVKPPHFAPKAKNCICIYLEGGPSQLDLFDRKDELKKLHGKKLPESFTKNVRFAFIKKESATVLGSTRKYARHGDCGMELSDLLPHLSTCA